MKVPALRKLKSGSYFIQLGLNGVSVPVTAATSMECKRQAELIKAEYRSNKRVIAAEEASTPTLKSAIEDYIAKYEAVLSPSTIRGYEQIKLAVPVLDERCEISMQQEEEYDTPDYQGGYTFLMTLYFCRPFPEKGSGLFSLPFSGNTK